MRDTHHSPYRAGQTLWAIAAGAALVGLAVQVLLQMQWVAS